MNIESDKRRRETDLDARVNALKALADKSRILMVNALLEKPHCAEELAERLRLAPSTISFHLRRLEEAGLVTKSKAAVLRRLRAALGSPPDEPEGFRHDAARRRQPRGKSHAAVPGESRAHFFPGRSACSDPEAVAEADDNTRGVPRGLRAGERVRGARGQRTHRAALSGLLHGPPDARRPGIYDAKGREVSSHRKGGHVDGHAIGDQETVQGGAERGGHLPGEERDQRQGAARKQQEPARPPEQASLHPVHRAALEQGSCRRIGTGSGRTPSCSRCSMS